VKVVNSSEGDTLFIPRMYVQQIVEVSQTTVNYSVIQNTEIMSCSTPRHRFQYCIKISFLDSTLTIIYISPLLFSVSISFPDSCC
jgi:hypothetical protein